MSDSDLMHGRKAFGSVKLVRRKNFGQKHFRTRSHAELFCPKLFEVNVICVPLIIVDLGLGLDL